MLKRWKEWLPALKAHCLLSAGIAAVLAFALLIVPAYVFHWDWTGFPAGTSKIEVISPSPGLYTATIAQSGKSLWDWLGLLGTLAIPVVVGIGAAWYTAQQAKASDRENTDNQRESALQAYIDKMSELLLDQHLRESQSVWDKAEGKPAAHDATEVRNIARVRTLTVLRRLDGDRKAVVLQFLHESKLIDKDTPIIDLNGADLSHANLSKLNLRNANLSNIDLSSTNLSETELYGADLSNSILRNMDLRTTGLSGADLSGTDLSSVDLGGSYLSETNLINAKLIGADMRGVYLTTGLLGKDPSPAALMNGADLTDANLNGANMAGVNLNAATLERTSLQRANLTGANLMAAHLIKTDMTDAILENADLSYIIYRDAIMPDKTLKTELPFGLEP
jgi:uncharacterized protein YjbI with pentapeptide repeats